MGASSLKMFFFWPLTIHLYGKIVPKILHLMRVSTFHLPIDAPNGTFSQPESTTGARRDCDARNCFDARTISDARGSNDARTEWIAHPIIGREGTLVWTLPKRTSPQPTRGDVELKVYFRQCVRYVPL